MVQILLILIFMPFCTYASIRVRHIEYKHDQIVTVRAAIGIATIIQVPDRPNSVVVGDQDKFKVEYLDQAITIKPLQPGVKSNLYVYTDFQRYNVQLVTGPEASADYVVYLENVKVKPMDTKSKINWIPYARSFTNETVSFTTQKIGSTGNGILLIEFQLKGSRKESIKPDWFWLTQEGVTKPIHNLIFSSLEVEPNRPVTGVIQVLQKDIQTTAPLRIEMRRKKTSFITLPEVKTWNKLR